MAFLTLMPPIIRSNNPLTVVLCPHLRTSGSSILSVATCTGTNKTFEHNWHKQNIENHNMHDDGSNANSSNNDKNDINDNSYDAILQYYQMTLMPPIIRSSRAAIIYLCVIFMYTYIYIYIYIHTCMYICICTFEHNWHKQNIRSSRAAARATPRLLVRKANIVRVRL